MRRTMRQRGRPRQGTGSAFRTSPTPISAAQKARSATNPRCGGPFAVTATFLPWLIIFNTTGLSLMDLSSCRSGDLCDLFPRCMPVSYSVPRPQRSRTAGRSLSPTSRMVMASISVWPMATGAARMRPGPIVSHGISRRPRLITESPRRRLPVRFRHRRGRAVPIPAAANTSRLPVSGRSKGRVSCHIRAVETT